MLVFNLDILLLLAAQSAAGIVRYGRNIQMVRTVWKRCTISRKGSGAEAR